MIDLEADDPRLVEEPGYKLTRQPTDALVALYAFGEREETMRPLSHVWRASAAALLAMSAATTIPIAATAQEAEMTMVATGEFTAPEAPGAKIMTFVIDVPAGMEVPFHSHGGRSIVLVLAGEMTLGPPGGTETTYMAGDVFIEDAGQVLGGRVTGSEVAKLVWTIVLPEGAELETPYQQ